MNTRKNRQNATMRKNRKNRQNATMRQNMRQEGGAKMLTTGSMAQVYHGTAKHTPGGLKKGDLMKTKAGRIVSKKQHAAGLKAIKRLRKAGYVAKKGTFKLFKKL